MLGLGNTLSGGAALDEFGPLSISDIMGWYDATDTTTVFSDAGSTLLTSNGAIQQWNDKSGNSYHLKQSTSAQRPAWNTDGYIDFDGAGDSLRIGRSGTTAETRGYPTDSCACTFVAVVAADDWDGSDNTEVTTGTDDYIWGNDADANRSHLQLLTKNSWKVKAFDHAAGSGASTPTVAHSLNFLVADGKLIMSMRIESDGTLHFGKDGTESGTTGSVTTDHVQYLGAIGTPGTLGATSSFNGKVYEWIVYNKDIGTADLALLISYLKSKHSIS